MFPGIVHMVEAVCPGAGAARLFDDDGDGGAKPGGVGPNPCLVEDGRVTEQEIMKAILHLSREVASIKSLIKPRT
jgi:hypothetical protein